MKGFKSYFISKENKAAITIQKHFRGYLVRQSHLANDLYSQYRMQCERVIQGEKMLQAQEGKTKVYLPQELPEVVLKYSRRKEAVARFHQMQKLRSILRLQDSHCLIIPRANLCGEFIVEQKLPVNTNSYYNMDIYLSHLQLFDEPVREFTRVFSKIYMGDLVASHPQLLLGRIPGVNNYVRSDNFPLYIEDVKGKKEARIGLIDLECMENESKLKGLKILARVFPYHLNLIKDEARRIDMQFDENALNNATEKGKKYLQVGYINHLKWLRKKGISTKNGFQPLQISPQRVEELITLLEKKLLKLNQGINDLPFIPMYPIELPKNFLIENVAQELAKKMVPLMISNIKAQIDKEQKEKLTQWLEPKENWQLVDFRSPIIRSEDLDRVIFYELIPYLTVEFKKKKLYIQGDIGRVIAANLTETFMSNLIKGGEIAYYNPDYISGYAFSGIRY